MMDDATAEVERLTAGIREILRDGPGPCSFFACPGPDHPIVDMATCNVCYPHVALRELLGETLTCDEIECITCGKEAPPCTHDSQYVGDDGQFYCKDCDEWLGR